MRSSTAAIGDARRALIEVLVEGDVEDRGHGEIVTCEGWFRSSTSSPRSTTGSAASTSLSASVATWPTSSPGRRTRWPTPTERNRSPPPPQVLRDQERDHPAATDRLRSILKRQQVAAGQHFRVLNYLAEQVPDRLAQGHSRSR